MRCDAVLLTADGVPKAFLACKAVPSCSPAGRMGLSVETRCQLKIRQPNATTPFRMLGIWLVGDVVVVVVVLLEKEPDSISTGRPSNDL